MGYIKVNSTSRRLYRHDNDMGTVIEFDMYGTSMKMFVPDAQYRPTGTVIWSEQNMTGNTTYLNIADFYIMGDYPRTSALSGSDIPTDKELQSVLVLDSIETAKECTDAIISTIGTSTTYAAGLCRSVSIGSLGTMDLPNLYELMVLWCEADNIDSMDPTADSYPSAKLGYTHSSGRFRNADTWASTEVSTSHAWCMYYNGHAQSWRGATQGLKYYNKRFVIPIKEL